MSEVTWWGWGQLLMPMYTASTCPPRPQPYHMSAAALNALHNILLQQRGAEGVTISVNNYPLPKDVNEEVPVLLYHMRTSTVPHAFMYTCPSHAPHMLLTCPSHAPHMLLTCPSHAPHMLLTCPSHAPHMLLTCPSHAPHMPWCVESESNFNMYNSKHPGIASLCPSPSQVTSATQTFLGFSVGITVVFGYSFLLASFVLFLVQERESKVCSN